MDLVHRRALEIIVSNQQCSNVLTT